MGANTQRLPSISELLPPGMLDGPDAARGAFSPFSEQRRTESGPPHPLTSLLAVASSSYGTGSFEAPYAGRDIDSTSPHPTDDINGLVSSLPYRTTSSPATSSTADKHNRRNNVKIEKERRARRIAQRSYQDKEALLTYIVRWELARSQSGGNKTASGLEYTKPDIDNTVTRLLAHYLSRDLEKATAEGREDELCREWSRLITATDGDGEHRITDEPLRGSLIWYDEIEHGTTPCGACRFRSGKLVGESLECRKHSMSTNMERRLAAIRDKRTKGRKVAGKPPKDRGNGIQNRSRL